ncbi:Tad domain-containing protein [Neobacillus drentensis]
MVLFTIFIITLFRFAGLAIDGGRLYIAKSELQKAVDAGALAGARILI